jgi:cyanate lyase
MPGQQARPAVIGIARRKKPLENSRILRSGWHAGCEIAAIIHAMYKGKKEMSMQRAALTEKILDIKREKGWSWKYVCGEIGGFSPMLITAALLGQMKLTKPQAQSAAKLFGLSKAEETMLNEVPHRGSLPTAVPTDPLIYRFYELVMVYGTTWKELIQEEFGDGIMSAIDFDIALERLPNPKGDRVKITMSGKFLPYKYYGSTGNIPEYGYRED